MVVSTYEVVEIILKEVVKNVKNKVNFFEKKVEIKASVVIGFA